MRALIRLRWAAVLVLLVLVLLVTLTWSAKLPLVGLFGILGLTAVSNLVLPGLVRLGTERVVGGVVILDALLLTALLALTGGPANPFSVLYLIHVTLAATMTRPLWTWLVVAASSGGFALVFFFNIPLPPELGGHHHVMHHMSYSVHLQGMWVAYTLAAISIALFVSRLSEALRQEREEHGRAARLLGLATLAAGAAHEIGNPLATIRVAASELERDLQAAPIDREHLEDLKLINDEVRRAQGVLERMAVGAGELVGELPVPLELHALFEAALRPLGADRGRVAVNLAPDMPRVRWPVQATAQAFTQLFRNGLQASTPDAKMRCSAAEKDGGVALEFEDQGVGMSPQVLERIGEPFFTTRPDVGVGLGVFIARSLIEHLGGLFRVDSTEGKGTCVRVWLPREVGR